MVRVCCICKLEYGIIADVSFHNIPKNEEMKAKWVLVIGREVKKHSAVCSRHFLEKDFHYKVVGDHVRRFLLPTAVPSATCIHSSINIAGENVDNYESDTDNSLPSHFDEVTKVVDNNSFNHIEIIYEEVSIGSINKELNTQIVQNLVTNEEIPQTFQYIEDCESHSLNLSEEYISGEEYIVENLEDTALSEAHTLEKEISQSKTKIPIKRTCTPRYIGDLKRKDFTSDLCYEIVENYFNGTKRKRKVLNQKVKRLNDKIESLKSLLDYLKDNEYFSIKESAALDCNPWKCKGPVRYYKDVNCTPIFGEDDNCCPVRYDCSHLKLGSPSKCYANGWEYEHGQNLPDKDNQPCNLYCMCNGTDGMFKCSQIYCGFHKLHIPKGYYSRHLVNSCCGLDLICPKPGEKIHKCIVDGQIYNDGNFFTPRQNPEMTCEYMKDYAGQNIAPFCQVLNCYTELYHRDEIRRNCVPVYFYNTVKCPYDYRCQNDKDVVIRANIEELKPRSDLSGTSDQMQCLFGNITMEIGDELKEGTDYNSVCVKCKCEVPPMPTCYRLPYDECNRNNYKNF